MTRHRSGDVLDASALLAFLHREPGHERVRPSIPRGLITAVNWCEVVQKAALIGTNPSALRHELARTGLRVVAFDRDLAEAAALLGPLTRGWGLSLADRACLALALQCHAPVLTADRRWAELGIEVEIRLIR